MMIPSRARRPRACPLARGRAFDRAQESEGTQEDALERALRPKQLDEYVGREKIRGQISIFIEGGEVAARSARPCCCSARQDSARRRCRIISREMGVTMHQTSGPVLEKKGDLAALLTNLEPNDVLFIDEIHRISAVLEETLYSAMEDYAIDIMIGEGRARAR